MTRPLTQAVTRCKREREWEEIHTGKEETNSQGGGKGIQGNQESYLRENSSWKTKVCGGRKGEERGEELGMSMDTCSIYR